ncbi:MAG: hypothetical protein JKY48_13330 [Flavobacteriales bacterium]|nr:hypothetical protein [Flavobacteriales bacterium]
MDSATNNIISSRSGNGGILLLSSGLLNSGTTYTIEVRKLSIQTILCIKVLDYFKITVDSVNIQTTQNRLRLSAALNATSYQWFLLRRNENSKKKN